MKKKGIITVVVAILFSAVASGPAWADKLVIFKNGKALRVKSAKQDGKWLKCEFEDKSFISVLNAGVLSVEESVAGSREGELKPNQVASGGGGFGPGARGGDGGVPSEVPAQGDSSQEDQEEAARAVAEEQAEIQRQNQANQAGQGDPRRGRIGQNRSNPMLPGGLQPLNPQPATLTAPNRQPGRGLSRRGMNRGMVTQLPGQNQQQQPNNDQSQDN
jgi:hypothetical protein